MIKDIVIAKEILERIKAADNIVLITHLNPDGDGLGAMSALSQFFDGLGKRYRLFCANEIPNNNQFLPSIHKLTSNQAIFSEERFDVIIFIDTGNLEHGGAQKLITSLDYDYCLINIDHHVTNNNFGQLNLVQSRSSSASEIIYDLLRLWRAAITKEMATALLNGIIYDTGIFSNDATTLSSLSVASHLLNLGARHNEINQNFLRNKSLNLLKLWGRAFERLSYNPLYDIAFTCLVMKDFEELNIEPGTIEGLSNFFNELSGAGVVMVLIEKLNGEIKGSLRTTRNDVDVSRLANFWQGGGHRKASGFSIKGNLVYNKDKWQVI